MNDNQLLIQLITQNNVCDTIKWQFSILFATFKFKSKFIRVKGSFNMKSEKCITLSWYVITSRNTFFTIK